MSSGRRTLRERLAKPFVVEGRGPLRGVFATVGAEARTRTGAEWAAWLLLLKSGRVVRKESKPLDFLGEFCFGEVTRSRPEPVERFLVAAFFFLLFLYSLIPRDNREAEVCEAVRRRFHGVIRSGTTTDTSRPLPYIAAEAVRRAREPSKPISRLLRRSPQRSGNCLQNRECAHLLLPHHLRRDSVRGKQEPHARG
jgi:hypothetical protein